MIYSVTLKVHNCQGFRKSHDTTPAGLKNLIELFNLHYACTRVCIIRVRFSPIVLYCIHCTFKVRTHCFITISISYGSTILLYTLYRRMWWEYSIGECGGSIVLYTI